MKKAITALLCSLALLAAVPGATQAANNGECNNSYAKQKYRC